MERQPNTSKYARDEKGFYNREIFEKHGLKFRPLDIHNGKLVIEGSTPRRRIMEEQR